MCRSVAVCDDAHGCTVVCMVARLRACARVVARWRVVARACGELPCVVVRKTGVTGCVCVPVCDDFCCTSFHFVMPRVRSGVQLFLMFGDIDCASCGLRDHACGLVIHAHWV